MSYPAYPEYKDSGVEWLGEVPAHWDVAPVRAFVEERTAKNANGDDDNYLSLMANVGVIPYAEKGDVGNKKPDDLSKCKKVDIGDLVINSMNYGIGSYGLSELKGVCSPVYIVLRPIKEKVLPRYALRVFENKEFQKLAQSFGQGILAHRSAIGWDDLKNIKIPMPGITEQAQFSAFLDHETARIDALVEEQLRLIALLKEKRQAVISHAVTKGLDPDVPMKDSGVEWLGEVPEHWTVGKVKLVAVVSGGYAFNSNEFTDSGIQLIRIGNLYQSKLQLDREPIYIPVARREKYKPFEVKWGDLLMSLTGTLGKRDYGFAVMYDSDEPSLLNQRVAKITPLSEKVVPVFLLLLLQSESYLNQIYSLPSGTKQANLSNSDVLSPWIATPFCLQEQSKIVCRVSELTSRLDLLINKSGVAISLLQERRSALISAAVTGKIDVRGWQPPTGSNVNTKLSIGLFEPITTT